MSGNGMSLITQTCRRSRVCGKRCLAGLLQAEVLLCILRGETLSSGLGWWCSDKGKSLRWQTQVGTQACLPRDKGTSTGATVMCKPDLSVDKATLSLAPTCNQGKTQLAFVWAQSWGSYADD